MLGLRLGEFEIQMGNLPQKMSLFFWAFFICIAKRNNFVEEIFSIQALFRRENSI
jgi:hypothetical protein